MSENHEYNGWKNYETWAMNLWLSNDQESDSATRELVAEVWDPDAKHKAADALKDWMDEQMPDLGASVWSDLLRGAFEEVNWFEVAEAFAPEAAQGH